MLPRWVRSQQESRSPSSRQALHSLRWKADGKPMESKVVVLSLGIAIAIGVWFSINAIHPGRFKAAEFDRCIGNVIEAGHISNKVSQVCRYLK